MMEPKKRILIVGGVAGGATAAARARRVDEQAEITLVEKGPYLSFANCGLPYFIGGDISKRSKLLLQTPEGFYSRYRVQALTHTEAVAIDREERKVLIRGPQGESFLEYDQLILAQGGTPILPAVPGASLEQTFKLWNIPDMDRIQKFLLERLPQTAVVAGGGFIGLEMAEALHQRGLRVTVVELAPQILTVLDADLAQQAQRALENKGVKVLTGLGLQEVKENRSVVLSDGSVLEADMVLFSVGVRPELTLAKSAGLEIGASGGLMVNEYLQTSDPRIFAAGDMVEVTHKVSGRKVRVPLAGPANRQGRIAATNALGGVGGSLLKYKGALGTAVVKIFDHTVAATGLTLKGALDAGFEAHAVVVHKENHASYYPGAQELTLKLVYEKPSGRLLGAQAFGGENGVEKRIDVLATALQGRMSLEDIEELDLAYAPPYSSANDPVNMAAFVGANDVSGFSPVVTAGEFLGSYEPGEDLLLDVRTLGEYSRGHAPGALHISVDELRERLKEVPQAKRIFIYCQAGFRGHLALRILRDAGYGKVFNITGGWTSLVLDSRNKVEM